MVEDAEAQSSLEIIINSSLDFLHNMGNIYIDVGFQIPSAYGPQRLDVLRRLEQLREMEPEIPEPAALPPPRDLEGSLRKKAV